MIRLLFSITLLAGVAACDRDPAFDAPLDPSGPHALRAHMAWVVPGQQEVVFLQPATLALHRVPLVAPPEATHVAPQGQGLLVLDAEGATWVPVDDAGLGAVRRINLDGAYRRVAFAPQANRVVLFGEAGGGRATLSNPNQIAIVDLDTGDAVERTLRSYGSAPQAIEIGPAGPLAGADRQIAWLLAERYLAVLDLAAPTAQEVVVHLVLADDTREVTPTQVAFAEVDGVQTAFIRAIGSDDVFSLTFPEEAAADAVPRPYLNQLAAAPGPSDLSVETVADGQRVFTCGGGTLSVTHPMTGRRIAVEVGLPASKMLPFSAPRDDDLVEGDGRYALLWSQGSNAVVFADLDLVERRGGRALTPLVLSAPVTALFPLPGRRGAVARLGRIGVALLDFEARTATPLTASGQLVSLVVEPSGDRVHALVEDGAHAVVTIDSDTGASEAVDLSGGGALLYVPGADRVVVDHRHSWGHVSVLHNETITEREGVLLEGALDR